jgi:large subunit ribosomal protein L16
MKQQPSRIFHKKNHKPSKFILYSVDKKNFYPKNGMWALKCIDNSKLTYKQIEAGRKTIRRTLSKRTKIIIRPFTNISLTKKGLGVRMGKGKGNHDLWVASVLKGQIIYEVNGTNYKKIFLALRKAADKMPFNCKIVKLTY